MCECQERLDAIDAKLQYMIDTVNGVVEMAMSNPMLKSFGLKF